MTLDAPYSSGISRRVKNVGDKIFDWGGKVGYILFYPLFEPLGRRLEHYLIAGAITCRVGKLRHGGATEEGVQRAIEQYAADFERAREIVKK